MADIPSDERETDRQEVCVLQKISHRQDWRTDGQADRRTGGQADRWTGGQVDKETFHIVFPPMHLNIRAIENN